MKIGIRISIYDDHDNELAKEAVWIPDAIPTVERRVLYDQVCEALWDVMEDLVRDASIVSLHNHGEPV